ncbi:hypothetical protein MRX96_045399 [Rhipicephalus microplus]
MEGMDVWSLSAILVILATPASCGRSFYIDYDKHTFVKDGQPFRLVGGSMHYFRVPRAYWDDRLYKLRMGGLNAVDFYIDWSGHEPEPEQYNFIDNYDVVAYLEAIKKADLLAVIRPGPYICGEVDNGGYPYWLLRKHPNIRYRSTQKEYVDEVTKWFHKLLPMFVPYLYKNGGPIIMFQVENEYGHLDNGCDPNYMEFMLTLQEKGLGKDVVMYHTNFPNERRFYCDKVRDILAAGNCASECNMSIFNTIRKVQVKPGGPLLVAEYYTGWMNFWGWDNNPAYPAKVLDTFKKLMDEGANIIIYMYHGGTSFGFKAATSGDAPIVTSYDFDAPHRRRRGPQGLLLFAERRHRQVLTAQAGRRSEGFTKTKTGRGVHDPRHDSRRGHGPLPTEGMAQENQFQVSSDIRAAGTGLRISRVQHGGAHGHQRVSVVKGARTA